MDCNRFFSKIKLVPAMVTLACTAAAVSCAGGSAEPALYPAPGSTGANIDTRLVLVFDRTPEVGQSGFIRIFDALTGEPVDSLDLSIPAGPTESRTYGEDCDYTLTARTATTPRCPTTTAAALSLPTATPVRAHPQAPPLPIP